MPYGTGSCTYCAYIANVAFFFLQLFNFFYNLHEKNYTPLPQKSKNSIFFKIHPTYSKKKVHAFTTKKITRLDGFFVHDLHFSRFFRGVSPWGLSPRFILIALGCCVVCGVSSGLCGGKWPPIGRQKVSRLGLPGGTEECQGGFGQYLAAFLGRFFWVIIMVCIPSFSFLLSPAGRVVGCLVLFVEVSRRRKEGKRSQSGG